MTRFRLDAETGRLIELVPTANIIELKQTIAGQAEMIDNLYAEIRKYREKLSRAAKKIATIQQDTTDRLAHSAMETVAKFQEYREREALMEADYVSRTHLLAYLDRLCQETHALAQITKKDDYELYYTAYLRVYRDVALHRDLFAHIPHHVCDPKPTSSSESKIHATP